MTDHLLDQILRTLRKAKKPLKARELASLISEEAETHIHRKEVNRVLYSDEVQKLVDLAEQEGRPIVAWSQHERQAIAERLEDESLARAFGAVYLDARRTAKRWHQKIHPELEIPVHERNGKYTLAALMAVTGYNVPTAFGTGLTGQRIRAVRTQLKKRNGHWASLTAVTKAKWTKLLKHNYHDCVGMKHVLQHCTQELERATPEAKHNIGPD